MTTRQEPVVVPNLVKVTELFLIPSSFLVAALGTADTNLHRAAVSVLGLVVSLLWQWCSWEAQTESTALPTPRDAQGATTRARVFTLTWFPLVFVGGWTISIVAHVLLIGRPLGFNR